MKSQPKIPSAEVQLLWLRDKLAGHQAFTRQRGKFFSRIQDLSWNSKSVAGFVNEFESFARDARTLGALLVKLRRDGWEIAAEELIKALGNEGRFIYGEDVDPERLESVTIALSHSTKIFDLVRLMMTVPPRQEILTTWRRRPFKKDSELVNELRRILPSLSELFGAEDDARRDLEFAFKRAYADDVWGPTVSHKVDNDEYWYIQLVMDHRNHFQLSPFQDMAIARGFVKPPEELGMYWSPEQLAMMAHWRLKLPKSFARDINFRAGFYPEADDQYWRTQTGVFVAASCVSGFGLVAFRKETPAETRYFLRYKLGNDDDREAPPVLLLEKRWRR